MFGGNYAINKTFQILEDNCVNYKIDVLPEMANSVKTELTKDEIMEDYYNDTKNYNYQASLSLEGYSTNWQEWILSQIKQEGLEKYKSWYARMYIRCGYSLHPELIEAHNKLFKGETN